MMNSRQFGIGFRGTRSWGRLGASIVPAVLLALAGAGCTGFFSGDPALAARDTVYDSNADGRAQLEDAIARAKEEGKRVLVQWGANWCGWCHKLHAYFQENEEARKLLADHYVLVLIDSDANKPLMRDLGVKPRGIPYLTVFDASGNKLVDQDTGSLETGSHHDPAKVNPFLRKWVAPKESHSEASDDSNAGSRIAVAGEIARKTDRRVFVAMGTEWCGWCRRLEKLLNNPKVKPIIEKNYVVVHLDQEKTPGAKAFREMNAAKGSGGVPWYAVTDGSGKTLATSDDEGKNTGYPARPDEMKHFLSVMDATAKHLDAEERAVLEGELRRVAATFL